MKKQKWVVTEILGHQCLLIRGFENVESCFKEIKLDKAVLEDFDNNFDLKGDAQASNGVAYWLGSINCGVIVINTKCRQKDKDEMQVLLHESYHYTAALFKHIGQEITPGDEFFPRIQENIYCVYRDHLLPKPKYNLAYEVV